MQVSIETLSALERRMTIGVPAEKVERQVQSRLQEAARTISLKGFRKGKIPIKVIKSRFGKGVRQEVVGEMMNQSYYEAVNQENVKPAGQPKIEAKSLEEGKDLEFVAIFEVYPEITLGDFSCIKVEKKIAKILDRDIDSMIETLRKQKQTYEEVDRPGREFDRISIDFTGTLEGEKFEGGEARDTKLILGAKTMIPGFEEGLTGKRKGEDFILSLKFPTEYHNKDLASKPVQFKVQVNTVAEPVLPKLDKAFFASFDVIKGGEKAFRKEVADNMARELKASNRNKIKTQIIDGLLATHTIDIPKALLKNEINVLRQEAMQQFGGAERIKESMLPADMFKTQAEKRVSLSLIMGEIIKQKEIKADPKTVRALIEEMAASYEEPDDVIKWYYSNKDQLATVESMALEEAVIDMIAEAADVTELECSYEEALKPAANTEAVETAEKSAQESPGKRRSKLSGEAP